jgi:hypothetical protein
LQRYGFEMLAKSFVFLLARSNRRRTPAQRATNSATHGAASSKSGDSGFTVFPVRFGREEVHASLGTL